MGIRVFHCDDSEAFTRLVSFWLSEHDDIEYAGQAHTAEAALAALPEARADVILLDTLGRPGDDALLLAVREVAPQAKVIVYSGYVRLMQEGALGRRGRRLPREGRRRRAAARRHPRGRRSDLEATLGRRAPDVPPRSAPLRRPRRLARRRAAVHPRRPRARRAGARRGRRGEDRGARGRARPERRRRSSTCALLGRNPARIIPAWRDFRARHDGPIRGIGEPIWAGRDGAELVECQLHEALLNVAFDGADEFQLLCPYDTSALDDSVVHEACAGHPHVNAQPSRAYRERERLLAPFEAPLRAAAGPRAGARLRARHARRGAPR